MIIKQLSSNYQNNNTVLIGAGTVLDAPTAKNAIMAGAKYIVSPAFNQETAIICNRYGIPYIPGCMTIKEIITSCKGASFINLYSAPATKASPLPTRSNNAVFKLIEV